MLKNKIKTAIILGSVILPGLTTVPVFAQEVENKNVSNNQINLNKKEKEALPIRVNSNFSGKTYNNKRSDQILEIQKAIDSKNLEDFNKTIKEIGIEDNFDQAQFQTIINAYTKAKSGDIKGAQNIIRNGDIAPVVNRFIMKPNIQLTNEQKNSLKDAEYLVQQNKIEEAKNVLISAGLPIPVFEKDKEVNPPDEVKSVIGQAKLLRSEGKNKEARQVLKDAGVSEKTFRNLEKEFSASDQREKNNFLGVIKNFFKFNKN